MKTTAHYACAEEKARFRRMTPADQDLFRQFRQNANWYRYWGNGLPGQRRTGQQKRMAAAWLRKALQAAKGLLKRGHGEAVRAEWREMFKTELPEL